MPSQTNRPGIPPSCRNVRACSSRPLTVTRHTQWTRLHPLRLRLRSPYGSGRRRLSWPNHSLDASVAVPAAAPPTSAAPVITVRALTADERDHFVISPEQLASVDRRTIHGNGLGHHCLACGAACVSPAMPKLRSLTHA
eukprot:3015210-Pleurochrysis_carterae.AAC.2